jgi:hypothetical protein
MDNSENTGARRGYSKLTTVPGKTGSREKQPKNPKEKPTLEPEARLEEYIAKKVGGGPGTKLFSNV